MDHKRLKELRILHNMTQAAVAHSIGMDTSQYCRTEKGDRRLSAEEAEALATMYTCTVDVVLGLSPISRDQQVVDPPSPPMSEPTVREQYLQDQLERRDELLDRTQSLVDKLISFVLGRMDKDDKAGQRGSNEQPS